MRVIITGGTGLIGTALIAALVPLGYKVIVVSRSQVIATQKLNQRGLTDVQIVEWDGRTAQGWGQCITPDSAIVNLAGATPAHWRWTKAYRSEILASRINAGAAVTEAIARFGPPAVLIQASASGYYGDCGTEILTETHARGHGFRADVCQAWEDSTAHVTARRCVLRTGIVLANRAGAFPSLRHFAQMMGRQLGSGQQWIPWVHHADVVAAIIFLIKHQALAGTFNLCAPEPAMNRDFIQAVQRIMKIPGIFPLPSLILRVCLGEMASAVLDSQRMVPSRLLAHNFTFTYPNLPLALCQLHEMALV